MRILAACGLRSGFRSHLALLHRYVHPASARLTITCPVTAEPPSHHKAGLRTVPSTTGRRTGVISRASVTIVTVIGTSTAVPLICFAGTWPRRDTDITSVDLMSTSLQTFFLLQPVVINIACSMLPSLHLQGLNTQ